MSNKSIYPVRRLLVWSLLAFPYPAKAIDEATATLVNQFRTNCVESSFINEIQLAQMPERRKTRRLKCIEENWFDRYIVEIEDANYQSTSQADSKFRSELVRRTELPFYTNRVFNDTPAPELYLQTEAYNPERDGGNKVSLDSLDGYSNVSDDND